MKCCICGTVKNCGTYLDKIFLNMEIVGALFETYQIILYYDHSNDNTLSKLKIYKSLYPDRFQYYVNHEPLSSFRTYNIAKGRNVCLNMIKEKYSDYEYFIMMDCDEVCSGNIKPRVLFHYLQRNDWDALSFNHPGSYYDIWAFSKDPFFVGYNHFQNGHAIYINYITNIINNTAKDKLISCFSAFNGFAIYRTKKFLNCSYNGEFSLDYLPKQYIQKNSMFAGKLINKDAKEDCEHRRFHFQAIKENGARIRISPHCLFAKMQVFKKTLSFL
uniref:Glycosyltransferase 2-like domain-containing protein n=1 Tax=viral metagenome TaxID=1070528 RepID=A0A6C0B9X7_9ZZZZ